MKNIAKGPILVVAAHPDDEVLGCGGTIAKWAEEGNEVHVLILADGESARVDSLETLALKQKILLRTEAAKLASSILNCKSIKILGFPDNRLDSINLIDIIKQIEYSISQYRPTVVLTHHSGDVNIDHRIVHDAVITATRPTPENFVKELLFFEVPSSTEWRPLTSSRPFEPNYFVNISSTLKQKNKAAKVYEMELRQFPHPRSIKAINSLAVWRGSNIGVAAAEAFILGRKIVD